MDGMPDMGTLGNAPAGAPSGVPAGMPGQPPPGAPPPAAGQESPAGQIALAKAQVQIAMSVLNSTISKFKPGSREHHIVMSVTQKLSREFAGSPTEHLAKSETDMLQASANQSGSASLNP